MKKILSLKEAIEKSNTLRENGKTIALSGGCFDILHVGHIRFLKQAKKEADYLFVFVESDKKVSILKGKGRPINSQKERVMILSSVIYVDFVILLPYLSENKQYDAIIGALKPDVLATTVEEKVNEHMERQAKDIGAKVVYVLKRIKGKSSTKFANFIKTYGL